MKRNRNTNKPAEIVQGPKVVATREKKKENRLTLTKLLFRTVCAVLFCYFVTTVAIIHSNEHLNTSVLEQDSHYQKQKLTRKSDAIGAGVENSRSRTDGENRNGNKMTIRGGNDDNNAKRKANSSTGDNDSSDSYELTAYIEPINQEDWKIKPLPVRTTTASALKKETYGQIPCSKLPELWPTSEKSAPTNKDPFLPWIHDVFPSADGKFVQFVAQNKRRCQSGKKMGEVKKYFQPNIALFQHVPVTRVTAKSGDEGGSTDTRYRISSHEEADDDGVETRFICRFKPSMEETLSVHNLNYDYHTVRKAYKATFTEEGFDNHMIWSSQLLFRCPVPESLQEKVRKGMTVENDFATDFVDLVPIRTPPRYGSPTTYLPERLFSEQNTWKPKKEWGENHILPLIQDSGRWENIPICKPSLMTYPDKGPIDPTDKIASRNHDADVLENLDKKKNLIACTWTSSSFETRGGKTKVSDGDQRLLQWLEFNKLVGVDHVYVYDNSGAFSDTTSLKPITDLFPGFVTRINWPAKICNNNPGNRDNKGERSSQYAATMSCHLRFGAHSDWLASFDTDEYMTPLGGEDNLKPLLKKADDEGIKILNWKSKRSKPRLQYFDTTPKSETCQKRKCFDPALPENKTFLEVYNCNIEKPPRKNVMPAEKAIYRPDFVKLFFVHYATVTTLSQMGKPETEKAGRQYQRRYRAPNTRYADEETEGTMLHTKAIVEKEVMYWSRTLETTALNSKIGVEWPAGFDEEKDPEMKVEIHGNKYAPNCYPVEAIDKHWVPKLTAALEKTGNPKY